MVGVEVFISSAGIAILESLSMEKDNVRLEFRVQEEDSGSGYIPWALVHWAGPYL